MSEAWLWVSGSLLLAVLWANLAWFFRQTRSDASGDFVARLVFWRFSPWLLQFLRLLYYVGVPAAALLLRRTLSERYLGLVGLPGTATSVDDWAHDVGWAAVLGVGAWALLALGWWAYRRAIATGSEGMMVAESDVSGWVLLREAAYHEIHWAFYRSVVIASLDTGGLYWGVWGGLALVALEAALNPAWRHRLGDSGQAPAQLMRGALAVVSSVCFLLTGNLWLALTLHWGVSWGLAALARAHFPQT